MPLQLNGTTGVSGIDGSAGTPALIGVDTNTGVRFGTDILSLVTGGSDRLYIDASGRLGVGTASPAALLHLSSGANTTLRLTDTAGSYSDIIYNESGTVSQLIFDADPTGSSIATGGTSILFKTDGNNAVTIDSSQRMGIGTVNPGALLDVAGTNGRMYIRDGGANEAKIVALNAAGTGVAAMVFETFSRENGRFDSSGRLLVGTSTSSTNAGSASPNFQVHGISGSPSSSSQTRWSADNAGPTKFLSKSRGASVGTRGAVVSADQIGSIRFTADDGTNFIEAARIEVEIDGTPGTNDMPGRLVFSTTADGASGPTERFRISNDGSMSAVIPGGSTLYPASTCRAWVNFNGTGTVAIRASYNVSSITDNGTGNYTVNFTTAMPDANYSWTAGQRRNVTIDTSIIQIQAYSDSSQTASALQVICYAVNPATSGLEDPLALNVSVFR